MPSTLRDGAVPPAAGPSAAKRRTGNTDKHLAAIVLAAGYSKRMKRFKPLLPFRDSCVLDATIRLFTDSGVGQVLVVVGHRADELLSIVEAAGARAVVNPNFDLGMFSSVCAGIRALNHDVEASFLMPADMPFVRPQTILQLRRAMEIMDKEIAFPVFAGRRGHPPLIRRRILLKALEYGFEGPLSTLLASHDRAAIEVPVIDQAIHLDLDTPSDYERSLLESRSWSTPTTPECMDILARQGTPSAVIEHALAVSGIACQLATELNRHGLALDLGLIRAGALLHDIAKGQHDHARLGAELLYELGFPEVARIIAVHTELDFTERKLNESAIVYLADKLIRGMEFVGIDRRFAPMLIRQRDNPPILATLRRRMVTAQAIALRVEERIGCTLPVALQVPGSVTPDLIVDDSETTISAQAGLR